MASEDTDILIIGAGACGLTAARELAKAGKRVLVIEGRNRIGGRIHTIHDPVFSNRIEAGAEFIHGELPHTIGMLKEYGISFHPVKGVFWQVQSEQLDRENNMIEDHHRLLVKHLKEVKVDMSIENFLNFYFPGPEFFSLKNSIRKFVEGYDAADPGRASVFAFRDEWLKDDDEQYRIAGGYEQLVIALARDCENNGCRILTSIIVKEIHWKQHCVEVIAENGLRIVANGAVITVSLGVLVAAADTKSSITFFPSLPEKIGAAKAMGYGGVIKIILQFRNAFWKNDEIEKLTGKDLKNLGFIFSGEAVPTWWTQLPDLSPILTGWLAGPAAAKNADADDKILLARALDSICSIFHITHAELSKELTGWQIHNWIRDPFSAGAYSYVAVNTNHPKEILNEPVSGTLFFAGEALSSGTDTGTVESALQSGFEAAVKVLRE